MIDRSEISGVAVSVAIHAGLIAVLWQLVPPAPPKPEPATGEFQVTLSDDVGLVSAAPDPSDEPPAQAAQGEPQPEEAAPDPQAEPDPRPTSRPTTRPTNSQTPRSRTTPVPTGNVTDPSKSNGPSTDPVPGRGDRSEAEMTGPALANIITAIQRQVQPCANRQMVPAQEATQILTTVQLKLNRDGSFAGLTIVAREGVTDENRRYVARVDDAIESIFAGCTPIRNLPPELYDVPRGWRQIKFKYRLRQR